VSWSAGGVRKTQLVPPSGRVLPGGRLAGADVSRAAPLSTVPLARVVRRTPDGWSWALQEWAPVVGAPPELHLSRWKGAPTQLMLTVDGDRLAGRATFQGRGITGFTATPAGNRLRIYVYLECSGCPGAGGGWKRMTGIAPRPDGSFRVFLRPEWQGARYRATVAGPNVGATRAPDAQATATA
jgi:hypothetical protein